MVYQICCLTLKYGSNVLLDILLQLLIKQEAVKLLFVRFPTFVQLPTF